jgi:thiamine pyrophosphokinase
MKAVLVLNGDPPTSSRLKQLAKKFPVYAADGGAAACLAAAIRPEAVVGDFDSLSLTSLPSDWFTHHYPEQDRTDFQKVLSYLPKEIDELLVLGGFGRRLDHFITNLLIAMDLPEKVKIRFEGDGQLIHRITPSNSFSQSLVLGSTLSLLPISKVSGVQTSGLKWNLSNADLGPGIQLGQSNQVEGPVEIKIQSGNLYLWVPQKDPQK